MATLAEFVTSLQSKFEFVGTADLVSTIGNVTQYDIPVLTKTKSGRLMQTQGVTVIDEGQGTEAAFATKEPREQGDKPPFEVALENRVDNIVTNQANVLGIVIGTFDAVQQWAIVTAYILNAGTVTATQKFMWNNGGTVEFDDLA